MLLKPFIKIFYHHLQRFICIIFFAILFYTRFTGLSWGLPYPMHPDERNMTVAVLEMECPVLSKECLKPDFFAYGQLPLVVTYAAVHLSAIVTGESINFVNTTMILRVISALSSVAMSYFLWKILNDLTHPSPFLSVLMALGVIFVPSFIQFSHFGTTESLLMLLYILLVSVAVDHIKRNHSLKHFALWSGMLLGLALGIKISSAVFASVPFLALLFSLKHFSLKKKIQTLCIGTYIIGVVAIIVMISTSPHNILAFEEYLGSMKYESDVGFGRYRAFYTRQFEYTIPVLFQSLKVFPYTLGAPFFLLFVFSFFLLQFTRLNNYLRLLFLIFFLPNAFIYAKWSRFLAPIYPLMMLFVFLYVMQLAHELKHTALFHKTKSLYYGFFIFLIGVSLLPGIAYLSIYTQPDVRFVASEWIYKNIPSRSLILAETANVVDIPIPSPNRKDPPLPYDPISFNFYDLEVVTELRGLLASHKRKSDYIFVPSRRIFANHTCYAPLKSGISRLELPAHQLAQGYEQDRCIQLAEKYPQLGRYYDDLFDEQKYRLVAQFESFPQISLFGVTLIKFPDEEAEETWTVFDHPVIRIYEPISGS